MGATGEAVGRAGSFLVIHGRKPASVYIGSIFVPLGACRGAEDAQRGVQPAGDLPVTGPHDASWGSPQDRKSECLIPVIHMYCEFEQ
jgi:hypothetical protein